jgi:hypothetical protein
VLSRVAASATGSNYRCFSRGADGCSTPLAANINFTVDHVLGSTSTAQLPLLINASPRWTYIVVNTGASQSDTHGAKRQQPESQGRVM